jgi:hypothetical protein
VVGAAVLVVIAIVAVVTLSGSGNGKDGNAGDAVKGYLSALSRGDAAAALSYTDAKPDRWSFSPTRS